MIGIRGNQPERQPYSRSSRALHASCDEACVSRHVRPYGAWSGFKRRYCEVACENAGLKASRLRLMPDFENSQKGTAIIISASTHAFPDLDEEHEEGCYNAGRLWHNRRGGKCGGAVKVIKAEISSTGVFLNTRRYRLSVCT